MDTVKVVNFAAANPQRAFPWHEAVPDDQLPAIRARIGALCGAPANATGRELILQIQNRASIIGTLPAEADSLDIDGIVRCHGEQPLPVTYINWDDFTHVDKLHLTDISTYFSDIWYPASDDIEIFDDTARWLISVSHEGTLRLVVRA